jgi:hypothetical protein
MSKIKKTNYSEPDSGASKIKELTRWIEVFGYEGKIKEQIICNCLSDAGLSSELKYDVMLYLRRENIPFSIETVKDYIRKLSVQ